MINAVPLVWLHQVILVITANTARVCCCGEDVHLFLRHNSYKPLGFSSQSFWKCVLLSKLMECSDNITNIISIKLRQIQVQ